MKENYTQLYPNEQVALAVGDYAFKHSTQLPKHITDHHAWGVESQERANYMISPLQAQFQVWFAKALGAKRSESRFACRTFFFSYCSAQDHLISLGNGVIVLPYFMLVAFSSYRQQDLFLSEN